MIVDHVKEALGATAKLDTRPSGLAYRSHIEAIPDLDKCSLFLTQPITRFAGFFNALVLTTAAVSFLLLLYILRGSDLPRRESGFVTGAKRTGNHAAEQALDGLRRQLLDERYGDDLSRVYCR